MRVELPSGGWAEIREKLRPGDRFALQDAPTVVVTDGKVVVRDAAANGTRALLARLITAWSFPGNPAMILGASVDALDEVMDLDDWDALEDAVAPLAGKARGRVPNPSEPSPTNAITSGS